MSAGIIHEFNFILITFHLVQFAETVHVVIVHWVVRKAFLEEHTIHLSSAVMATVEAIEFKDVAILCDHAMPKLSSALMQKYFFTLGKMDASWFVPRVVMTTDLS